MKTVRRDTKKWAREHERFRKRVEDFILAHGGSATPDRWRQYELPTVLGTLRISVSSFAETIFTAFDESDRARRAGIDCNPYTGKWNFHYFDHDATFNEFADRVAPLLKR